MQRSCQNLEQSQYGVKRFENGGRTSLGNTNHVMTSGDSRNGVCLDGGSELVATKFNILQHDRVQSCALELKDWSDWEDIKLSEALTSCIGSTRVLDSTMTLMVMRL